MAADRWAMDDLDAVVCSRAGCSNTARWLIQWRNPRIHAHKEFLESYLCSRAFPVSVTPAPERDG